MKTLTRKTRRLASYAEVPKTYRELCQRYLPRPVHDDNDDAAATARLQPTTGSRRSSAFAVHVFWPGLTELFTLGGVPRND